MRYFLLLIGRHQYHWVGWVTFGLYNSGDILADVYARKDLILAIMGTGSSSFNSSAIFLARVNQSGVWVYNHLTFLSSLLLFVLFGNQKCRLGLSNLIVDFVTVYQKEGREWVRSYKIGFNLMVKIKILRLKGDIGF